MQSHTWPAALHTSPINGRSAANTRRRTRPAHRRDAGVRVGLRPVDAAEDHEIAGLEAGEAARVEDRRPGGGSPSPPASPSSSASGGRSPSGRRRERSSSRSRCAARSSRPRIPAQLGGLRQLARVGAEPCGRDGGRRPRGDRRGGPPRMPVTASSARRSLIAIAAAAPAAATTRASGAGRRSRRNTRREAQPPAAEARDRALDLGGAGGRSRGSSAGRSSVVRRSAGMSRRCR